MVGVGAVVFFGDAVILVRRNNQPGKGRWSLPGGLVELGERLEEALEREIKEELSVDVAVKGFLDIFERVIRDHAGRVMYHYVVLDYWSEVVSGVPRAGSDAADMMLVPEDTADVQDISGDVKAVLLKAARLRKEQAQAEARRARIFSRSG
jgi:8-oxo-dGTP diphosphatase